MTTPPPTPTTETLARFAALQEKLVPLWRSIRALNQDEQTIVVVPAMHADVEMRGAEMQAYEERFLFLLLLLRQPRARLVYVTGQAIHPSIIDYYFDLMPGVISSHARKRLFLVSPLDASPRSLTRKLLERPRMIARLKALIPNPDRAHLVPYSTTEDERELALRLGIPMYANDPRLEPLGTKSGGRRLFREEGVPLPAGCEDLHTEDDLVRAVVATRRAAPEVKRLVIKLNEGVSGLGNANLDITSLPPPGSADEAAAVRRLLPRLQFESATLAYDKFLEKLAHQGGIVEERIQAPEIRSPSVQLRITPLGEVELLSTHDQLLGGPSGQSYLGCRFPADEGYAALISREAAKVGRRLVKEGVIGRFALDFVVARAPGQPWRVFAIELNLRKGGTTHPFLTLQFLTDGKYDAESAQFVAPDGRRKFFVASDHLESERYKGLTPEDLFDLALRHGLHFDQSRLKGVVFHMMSALPECGRCGLTAVADSPAEADALYRRCLEVLDQETRA